MGQTVFAIIKYIVFLVSAFFVGCIVVDFRGKSECSGILKAFYLGQMMLFLLIQILAVPMILLRVHFNVLFYSVCAIYAILLILGIARFVKSDACFPRIRGFFKSMNWVAILFLILAVVLILFQFYNYLFMQHLDEDDTRWIAEANDALEYGDMMTRDFYTGEKLEGTFSLDKDVASPWPMYYAILSRLLNIRTAIFAHTIYAPLALLVMYGVYYLLSRELFRKKEARFAFLLAVAVIHLFFAGTTRPQSVVSLVRIWQGKASVAATIIPGLLCLFTCINKKDETRDYLAVSVVSGAACLMTGIGISAAAVMCGVFGAYNIFAYQRWRRIPLWLFSLIIPIASGLVFFYKGGI